jgi:hypothetical protein
MLHVINAPGKAAGLLWRHTTSMPVIQVGTLETDVYVVVVVVVVVVVIIE